MSEHTVRYIQEFNEREKEIIKKMQKRMDNEYEEQQVIIRRIRDETENIQIPNIRELKEHGLKVYTDNYFDTTTIGIGKEIELKIDKYLIPKSPIAGNLPEELIYKKKVEMYVIFNIITKEKEGVILIGRDKEPTVTFHIGIKSVCVGDNKELNKCEYTPEKIKEYIEKLKELNRMVNIESLLNGYSQLDKKQQKILIYIREKVQGRYTCENCGAIYTTEKDRNECDCQT